MSKSRVGEKAGKIISHLLVVAWMGIIFSLSAQPGEESADLSGGVSHLVMKIWNWVFDSFSVPPFSAILKLLYIQGTMKRAFCQTLSKKAPIRIWMGAFLYSVFQICDLAHIRKPDRGSVYEAALVLLLGGDGRRDPAI